MTLRVQWGTKPVGAIPQTNASHVECVTQDVCLLLFPSNVQLRMCVCCYFQVASLFIRFKPDQALDHFGRQVFATHTQSQFDRENSQCTAICRAWSMRTSAGHIILESFSGSRVEDVRHAYQLSQNSRVVLDRERQSFVHVGMCARSKAVAKFICSTSAPLTVRLCKIPQVQPEFKRLVRFLDEDGVERVGEAVQLSALTRQAIDYNDNRTYSIKKACTCCHQWPHDKSPRMREPGRRRLHRP
jgi:hypothetical protein